MTARSMASHSASASYSSCTPHPLAAARHPSERKRCSPVHVSCKIFEWHYSAVGLRLNAKASRSAAIFAVPRRRVEEEAGCVSNEAPLPTCRHWESQRAAGGDGSAALKAKVHSHATRSGTLVGAQAAGCGVITNEGRYDGR